MILLENRGIDPLPSIINNDPKNSLINSNPREEASSKLKASSINENNKKKKRKEKEKTGKNRSGIVDMDYYEKYYDMDYNYNHVYRGF
ncbi:hypothetical protein CONCODRAFT_2488 [Conidiobolus coronatus NRRL 28638]|uniref:Uncharacterized protein n=1 Tax=Conidiobolus coronatus (strain ATCC 28846 / CBS 209.66 / NRRL 28638) TaxID=796925 RepID=A0A137PHJ0_CONC2|nr:hypothetical protein CONCODRAFT_2488 [Conidiobolus coronatus NRRL 28638]|eukprot:KXN74474.1 hypothetical protein CONCODRAFT_2488 [Conidiobolus coronatus NRRL 28638]